MGGAEGLTDSPVGAGATVMAGEDIGQCMRGPVGLGGRTAGYSGEGPGWWSEGRREPGGQGPVALSGPGFAVSASGGSGSESAARLHPSDPATGRQRDSKPGAPGPPPKATSLSPGTGGGQAGLT